jgi:hypothetical protein
MDEVVLSLANGLGYEYRRGAGVHRFQRPGSPFILGFEATNEHTLLPHIYVRTTSWNWPGERSDLNDIFSTCFAVTMRQASGISCRFMEVPNEFSGIRSELYARYLIPEQPFLTGYPFDAALESIKPFFASAFWAEASTNLLFQACGASDETQGSYTASDEALTSWAGCVKSVLGSTNSEATYNSRIKPSWWYYRASSGTAIVRSQDLAMGLAFLGRPRDDQFTHQMRTDYGVLSRDRDVRNYMPNAARARIRRILTALEGSSDIKPAVAMLENQTIAAAGSHCIFLQTNTGRREYHRRIKEVRRRNAAEAEYIFSEEPLEWVDYIPGDRFQSLVADLLDREPGVSRVRPVGGVNEADGGRDYLIEWTTPLLAGENPEENVPPSKSRRVAVQVKSNHAPVGRADVTGVYDTMKHYRVEGYLLVVRSRLTVPLVDLLDGIRAADGLFADWWEGSDVEERLRKYPDLLQRYRDIVHPKC